jgi:hypothetical protein
VPPAPQRQRKVEALSVAEHARAWPRFVVA